MSRILLSSLTLLLSVPALVAQDAPMTREERADACTSIMVGKKASVDGSVITSHTCDGNYRAWLNVVPRKTNPAGTKRPIRWGLLHTETPTDEAGVKVKGEIPQVESTYSYFNSGYPFLNEKQLAMGEATISGRRDLESEQGLFLVEELQAVAMERCVTAREAVKLMGELAERYGYGDSGECLTVADPKEVWHFEIFGPGKGATGAVWAAVRIPDDHVGVSANIPRIGEIDLKNPNIMASANVFTLAKEKGWWDGKETFKFWKAYGGGKKPFGIRDFFILSTLAPSLGLKYEADELPFSVKPEKAVGPKDVAAYFRQTYEGTPYDRTKNLLVPKPRGPKDAPLKEGEKPEIIKSPVANPWMGREIIALFNALKPGAVENQRTISVPQCAYSTVIQCRSWLPDQVGGLVWFSLDNPAQSPRIPLFAGLASLPESFATDMNKRFRTDSAGWQFRRANKLATVKWGLVKDKHMAAVMEYEEKGFSELPDVERKVQEMLKADPSEKGQAKVQAFLTSYTADFAGATMRKWWELGDQYWHLLGKGF